VIRAAEEAVEPGEAVRWLLGVQPATYEIDARIAASDFLTEMGETPAALRWLDGPEPKLGIARASLLLESGRIGEAAEAYSAAIATDPSLKEETLEAALTPKLATAGSNVVNLRGPRPVAVADEGAPLNRLGRDPKTFADVGGLEDVKKDISRKIIQPFRNPSLFSKFKRKAGGGVLLLRSSRLRQDDDRARYGGGGRRGVHLNRDRRSARYVYRPVGKAPCGSVRECARGQARRAVLRRD